MLRFEYEKKYGEITAVKKTKNGKFLRFTFSKDGKLKEKQYTIKPANNSTKGLKFIEHNDFQTTLLDPTKKQKRFLLEDHNDIENQLLIQQQQRNVPSIDFFFCIFLFDVNLSNDKFNKNLNFDFSIFCGEVDFENTNFIGEVNFKKSIFIENVNFSSIKICKEVNFDYANFNEEVNFMAVTFINDADFSFTKFNEKADFTSSTFLKKVIFYNSIFNDILIFNKLNSESNDYSNFELNLELVKLERIQYNGANIKKASNRETFLILKNLAVKQNDQIKALEFHTKEHDTHLDSLKCKCIFSDKFILCFEKWVSNFGTDVSLPLLFIIIFNSLFIISNPLIAEYCFNTTDWDCKCLIEKLNLFAEQIYPFTKGEMTFFKLVSIVINSILLYEVIKSFRKFSRRL